MGWFDLKRAFPPDWKGRPPQMPAEDWPLWEAFRRKHANEYESFHYNVQLSLKEPPPGLEENILKAWKQTFSKRVDAVGVRSKAAVDIFEVTQRAGLRAIGQILTYTAMWNKVKPLSGKVLPILIANEFDPDIEPFAKSQGVILINPYE